MLLPPTEPGPAPAKYGAFLRRPLEVTPLPELFLEGSADGEEQTSTLIEAAAAGAEATKGIEELAAEARRRYDWVRRGPGDVLYGRIVNPDRFGLLVDASRANEPIQFVEVDPETGKEKLASVGAPAVSIGRDRALSFGFAETTANRIEQGRRALDGEFTRADFDTALELVEFAVEHRAEAPNALEVAEDLARRALAYDPKSVEAALELARVFEAGFRFEKALETYSSLREQYPHRALPVARMGLLEEKLLLFDEARADLEEAVHLERTNFEARFALGGFLARRGEYEAALEHLRAALKAAPSDPSLLDRRVAIRVALADALLALGELGEADGLYRQAYGAGSDAGADERLVGRARAGMLAVALLAPADGNAAEGEEGAQGFELLLDRGIAALAARDFPSAKDLLEGALELDPLRAVRPLSALAYLGLVTANEGEAMGFVERALEAAPHDAYALYLRGFLLGRQDDYDGARASLMAALDEEVAFEDALSTLGRIAFQLGHFQDARRLLERAVEVEPERPSVHALLGLDFLRLGTVSDASAAFDAALALSPADPVAKAGKAWCAYLGGDVTEAQVLLRDLDDARRAEGDADPWRLWARAQIDRIVDHVEKVEWRDSFNRSRLINGWQTRESDGPTVQMEDGAVRIEGVFSSSSGVAEVYREYAASDFVSFSARLFVSADTHARTGIRIARERQRRGDREVIGEASVSRFEDGALQVRILRKGRPPEITDMAEEFPVERWVRLTIERSGEASDSNVTISLDGVPLVENISVPSVGAANAPLLVGLFVEGDAGRSVRVLMDDASVVYRGNR
ncbi:MAG TPA: tetratricopeptide repeat protein [Planctomycetes bacterium]|nr:tetratricopeptide repeat protein [Planctomycetota bacterium]